MKSLWCLLVCLALNGCASSQHYSALGVVRRVDAPLAAERTVAGFEGRLVSLGARIETDSSGARTATLLVPPHPAEFPPRSMRIVYRGNADGSLQLEHARILPPLIVEHEKA